MNLEPEQLDREPDPLDRLLAEARWPEARPEVIQRLRKLWRLLLTSLQRHNARPRRRKIVTRVPILAAAAVVVVCVWLGILRWTADTPQRAAFAETLEQLHKATTVTWKTTFYWHITSKDGGSTWLSTETRPKAYKAPGHYRDTSLDEKGQIHSVEITDVARRKRLQVFPETREATLSEPVFSSVRDHKGPFHWVQKELEDANLQWVERRKTKSGEVNIFRHAFRDQVNGRDWSYDFWIDQKTKRLVEVHVPGADVYDPEKDPARNTPPGKRWSGTVPGCVEHDIVFDANLDDSLFSMEPPPGYAVKTERRGQVTEKEMIDYLGALADFNGKMFPDEPRITSDRINKVWLGKAKKDWTPAERKLIETVDFYTANRQSMPNYVFIEDQVAEKTFRYIGKGVKLGNKDRIVCWYKLKGAKIYRVVYGDLSVKDVAPEDLPLPVEK